MKGQIDEYNYESLISRLSKGTMDERANSLKKLNFLYDNARSRIYLYERRITECLQILLLIEEKQISFQALTLLEKVISNSPAESQVFSIIKKRLLGKIVFNLGSIEISVRKISHKCLLQYVRKLREYETIIVAYIKTAIQQQDNIHLKLKSINSLHSLIMAQSKYFVHGTINCQILLEELIHASFQKEHLQIRKAGLLCLIYCLRLDGSEKTLKLINATAQNQLFQTSNQSDQLASLIELIMKYKTEKPFDKEIQSQIESAPSPKFNTLDQENLKKDLGTEEEKCQKNDRMTDMQIKIFNQITFAEDFLKNLQKTEEWEVKKIKEFVPYLQKYLIDESIKLFSISKKIVEVILDSECQKQREYYVVLVPCVVNGIGNKRFIVRKNLNKLVRQYIKNHTDVWVKSFIERIAKTSNSKVKQMLIELFIHAYRISPEFYFPTDRTFSVLERQIKDQNSHLKWKAVDCLIMVIERQATTEKMKEDMMSTLSPEVYHKLLRKMNKTHNSIGSHSGSMNEPLSPVQRFQRRERRNPRFITDEPIVSSEKGQEDENRKKNVSEEKQKGMGVREKKIRKSHAEIDSRQLRIVDRKGKEEKQSLKKLPELKKGKLPNHPNFLIENNDSPVKRSMGEKNIMYIEKQNLPRMTDAKHELDKSLHSIRDNSWHTQFDCINNIRCIVEHHQESITDESFTTIINELLGCLNNMRSGVCKISLICLGQLMRKFHKRTYPFTDNIVNMLIKKSITTSDFIQEEIKKCIIISVEELCPNRIISSLNSLKDHKTIEIKTSVLNMIESMIRNDRIYLREKQWIWITLIDFHEDQNFNIRNEARKSIKAILESHKQWKNDVIGFKSFLLEKIEKILKSLSTSYGWIEIENKEFNKMMMSKLITSKFFAAQYSKFQEHDRAYTLRKNLKQRIKLINEVFSSAFDHPGEFELNMNAKKYIQIVCEHIDQKNPALLLNGVSILSKAVDVFPIIIEDSLPLIFEKTLGLIEIKKTEIGLTIQKFLHKLINRIDSTKVSKEFLRLCVSNNGKHRNESINQLIILWKTHKISNNIQGMVLKVFNKLVDGCSQEKLKEIIGLGVKKFGGDFRRKIEESEKLAQYYSQ